MSDKTSRLRGLGEQLKKGLNNLNEQAKAKAEKRPQQEAEVEPDFDVEDIREQDIPAGAKPYAAPDDLEIDDGLIIEGETDDKPKKRKSKGLDKKQKLLAIGAMAFAAFWFMKSKDDSSIPTDIAQLPASQSVETPSQMDTDVASSAFGFEDTPEMETPIEVSGSSTDSLGFGDSNPGHDAANAPMNIDLLTAGLNQQFGAEAAEPNQVLDPFSGEVKTVPAIQPDLPTPTTGLVDAPLAANSFQSTDASTELALSGDDSDSPFLAGGSNSTELSGTKTQNPDSEAGVLLDQGANADVADLKAKIAEKDGRIGSLESEVSKLKTELATAKLDVTKANKGPMKAQASDTPQKKAAQSTTLQRSPSTQRTATAQKAVARPQICVTAVAQAARNCTTCVPHAFITHQGSETMLGQGDFIEGLRVNIVGDRLDLQNAGGVVVHKFWSSPNGCAAG